nr:hypothetical protein [Rhodococcus qingshengii]
MAANIAWKNILEDPARRTLKLAILAGIALVSINSCAPKEQTLSVETAIEETESGVTSNLSTEQVKELESSVFISLPETVRIEALAGYLETDKIEANRFFGDYLNSEQKSIFFVPDPLKTPEKWRPQEVLNNYTLGIWDASVQGDQLKDIDNGRKLLSLVMDPGYKNFEITQAKVGNGLGGIVDVYRALPMDFDSKVSNMTFMGHDIGTAGGDIVLAESLNNNERIIFLFTNISTSSGKIVSILTDTYKPTDPRVDDELNKLAKNGR